jgi:serine/threonine protein kinase
VDPSPDSGGLIVMTEALAPGTMVGEYRVEHKLGEGGMATVYAAVHPVIGKQAAIKVMSPRLKADAGAVSRFVLEARAVNRIGHPNIVDVFGYGVLPDGRSFFVMEWLHGETLHERLWRQHGPLPLPEVIHILDEMCDALEAAHRQGIVHRDLKPANVFVCNDRGRGPEIKLLDFGVAKLMCPEYVPHRTDIGSIVGTPEYVSPEQARARDVDGRSDLYALGVMAYEMVLGRLPFLADNPLDSIDMHVHAPPPRPRILWKEIPASLEQLLLGLLAKDPAERPTVPQVRAVLGALTPTVTPALDRLHVVETTERIEMPRPFYLQRRRRLMLAAVALAFVLLAFLAYRPEPSRAQQPAPAPSPPVASAVTERTQNPPGSAPTPTPAGAAPGAPGTASGLHPSPASPSLSEPRSRGDSSTRRPHRRHKDANYLLDPFVK